MLETVTARERAIGRTHRTGVLTNAGLAALKLGVGSLAGSRALVADGVHSLSDVLMNAGAWFGWRWAERPRDADHHYGHGNGEALATLVVGLIVAGVGVGLMWSSFGGQPSTVGADWLGALAVAAELVTIAVKFGLARLTARHGREYQSSLLMALARDNRADMLTSALVLLAIVGTIAGLRWLEPIAALAIGLLIVVEGSRSAWEGINVLMDRHTDPALTEQVRTIAGAVAGVRAVDDVRVHPLGTHLRLDMEIAVDGTLDVASGHAIAHAVEAAIRAEHPRIREVAVHVNPANG
jgi:cation diffusion facilitator family transporter